MALNKEKFGAQSASTIRAANALSSNPSMASLPSGSSETHDRRVCTWSPMCEHVMQCCTSTPAPHARARTPEPERTSQNARARTYVNIYLTHTRCRKEFRSVLTALNNRNNYLTHVGESSFGVNNSFGVGFAKSSRILYINFYRSLQGGTETRWKLMFNMRWLTRAANTRQ